MRAILPPLRSVSFLVALVAGLASLKAEPGPTVVSYQDKKITLTAEVLEKLPRLEADATGKSERHHYAGVKVADVLGLVGAPLGEALKKDALTLVVKIRGADGFTVMFALAEFDANFSDRTILLADQQDGATLEEKAGPFRVVIPEDKRPSRWVRQVVAIEVGQAAP